MTVDKTVVDKLGINLYHGSVNFPWPN